MNDPAPVFSSSERPDLLLLAVTAAMLPALFAFLLALLVPTEVSGRSFHLMRAISFESAHQLEAIFDSVNYSWPPEQQVPALAITRLPNDMTKLSVNRRKALFFRALLPLVLTENRRLADERRWLEEVKTGRLYSSKAVLERLSGLAREYGLDEMIDQPAKLVENLYERIDGLPVGLVLAQAANETGWGTSRFSREVNNLFGEWTYVAEEGILPRRRLQGARHYVRRFAEPYDSVRSYMNMINRVRAYELLRTLRARMRSKGQELDPLILATGLVRYSAKGKAYVAAIQSLIRSNGLDKLEPSVLSEPFFLADNLASFPNWRQPDQTGR